MRKIPYIYNNPLDNLFYELSELTSPCAYSIGSIICFNSILF